MQVVVDDEIAVELHNDALVAVVVAADDDDGLIVRSYVDVDFHIVAAANWLVCNPAIQHAAARSRFSDSRICLSHFH